MGSVAEGRHPRVAHRHVGGLFPINLVLLERAVIRIFRPAEIDALQVRNRCVQGDPCRGLFNRQLIDKELRAEVVFAIRQQAQPYSVGLEGLRYRKLEPFPLIRLGIHIAADIRPAHAAVIG